MGQSNAGYVRPSLRFLLVLMPTAVNSFGLAVNHSACLKRQILERLKQAYRLERVERYCEIDCVSLRKLQLVHTPGSSTPRRSVDCLLVIGCARLPLLLDYPAGELVHLHSSLTDSSEPPSCGRTFACTDRREVVDCVSHVIYEKLKDLNQQLKSLQSAA